MKHTYNLVIAVGTVLLLSATASAQNVGVDVATPQQKLDVAGALKVGNTTNGVAGSLRWTGSEFQFHDGTQWVTLNANSDDQIFDIVQLSGNTLELSIENDGQPTHTIDLSPYLDNTDDQTFDQISINASNQLLLSLEGDGQPTHILDLSGYLDNTDDQRFDVIALNGTNLELSIENDGNATHVIDLSAFMDNTDDQTIDQLAISGNTLQLSLEGDGQPVQTLDLSQFMDNTDDQTIDNFAIVGNTLQISLENDGLPVSQVNLAPYLDNTDDQQISLSGNTLSLEDGGTVSLSGFLDNTDDQQLTLAGNVLTLEDGGTVNLASYLDNTDDQTIDELAISGNTLQISLEGDNEITQTLDLSQFMDNTDDQTITNFSISGNTLQLELENDGQPAQQVNLAPYLDNTDDQQLTLAGNVLTLEDGGTVNLASYLDNTDDQNLSGNLTGTTLEIDIEDGTTATVDLDPLRRLLIDADDDTKVEVEANADEDKVRITTAGTERMIVDQTGNVGVGLSLTAPLRKLHVQNAQGSGMNYPLLIHNQLAANTGSAGSGIGFLNHGTNLGATGPKMAIYSERTADFSQGKLHFLLDNNQNNDVADIGDAKMTILSNGNVGVGTITPGALFSVNGLGQSVSSQVTGLSGSSVRNLSIDASGTLTVAQPTGGNAGFWNRTGTNLTTATAGDDVTVDQGASLFVGPSAEFISDASYMRYNGPRPFYITDATSTTYLYSANTYLGSSSGDNLLMRGNTFTWNQGIIQGNGNVGIGTTAPTRKLDVNGDIAVSSILYDRNLDWSVGGTGENLEFREPEDANKLWGQIIDDNGLHMSGAPNIYADGNIGSGTTSPAGDLHVYRADNDIASIYATGGSEGSGMFYAGQSTAYGGGFVYDGDGSPALVGGTDRITFFRRSNNTDYDVMSYAQNSNSLRISSLAGSGNRVVQANGNGDLFASNDLPGGDASYIHNQFGSYQSAEWQISGRARVGSEFYYNSWIRNMNGGRTGLYWEAGGGLGWHIYPRSQQDMIFRTGNGNGGIVGTVQDETPRGYIHWTTGNNIGFMDHTRNWTLRTYQGGGEMYGVYYANDFRPYIIYDRNNTGYFWNGDGESRMYRTEAQRGWGTWTQYDANNTAYYINPSSTSAFNDLRANVFYDRADTYWYLDPNAGMRITGQSEIARNSGYTYVANAQSWGYCNGCYSSAFGCCASNWWGCTQNCYGTSCSVCGRTVYAKMSVNGGMYSYAYWTTSDKKYKSDVSTIPHALNYIKQVRGVTYKLIDPEEETSNYDQNPDMGEGYMGPQIGFIAQELQEVLPQLVHEEEIENPETGEKEQKIGVAYGQMTALLVEGMKEQQKMIEQLQAEIASLKAGAVPSIKSETETEVEKALRQMESNMDQLSSEHQAEMKKFMDRIRGKKVLSNEEWTIIGKMRHKFGLE